MGLFMGWAEPRSRVCLGGSSAPRSSLALCAWAEVQREFTHRATLDCISHSVYVLLRHDIEFRPFLS